MATKTTGYEFKKFLADDAYWYKESKETYYDDPEITVNDAQYDDIIETVNDTDVVRILSGVVVFSSDSTVSLESFFRKWRKMQNRTIVMFEICTSNRDVVCENIKAHGGKIII